MSEKTEEPTPKRLRKAQEEGDSGQSAFAAQSVAFFVAVALVPAAVRAMATHTKEALGAAIAHASEISPSATIDAETTTAEVIALAAPVLLAALLAGSVASLVQTGGFFATKKLTPKLERLDVIQGLRSLFSTARLFSVVRALAFGAVVSYLTYGALRTHAGDLARVSGRISWVGPLAGEMAYDVAQKAALVGLALAAIDIVVVRRGWKKKLRMGKDEVKREHKDSEGDPQIKAARERAHHEMLASATVANVRTASVVIVNPTHLACALRYDEKEGDQAPMVVASGEGELAQRIVQAARAFGVPILRDVPLARALIELEVGDAIPEALYEAVAEILRDAWEESGVTSGTSK